jgi:uroporphyrin-3 C-methyltransferase
MTGEPNKPSDDTAKKATSKANEKTSAATDNSENSTIENNALDASTSKGDLEVKDGKTTSTKSKKTKDMDMTLKKDSAKGTVSKKAENNPKKITAASSPKRATSDKSEIPTNQQKTSKISIIALIILLLLIIGLAVSASYGLRFWTGYSTKQEQRLAAIESISNAQLIKIEALSQEQARKNSDQIDFLATIKKEQGSLQKQINQRLDSHTERLRALAGTSRNDWLLAEARYLLRLASQRLLVENSTVGAQALLHSADSILLSIDDPELMPVRSAIAAEMIALKLAKAIDRPGIYLQLSALKDEVQTLPLIPHRPKSKSISAEILLRDNEPKQWYSPMVSSINTVIVKLKGFVQIRQHDQAPDLLISEQQQLQIINNLMLMLEQAQYSLLHEEELIYQASLQKAKKWWRSYYSHYSEYEVINHELNKLLNKEITQTIPTINRSTKLLTDYIDRFHKLNVDNTNTSNEFAPTAPSPSADAETQEKAL